MEQAFYPEHAAHRLASACLTGLGLKALPEAERPQNLEQGYAVQSAFVDQLGEGVAGWKLAGASPRGLRGELPNSPATGTLIPFRVVELGAVVQVPPGWPSAVLCGCAPLIAGTGQGKSASRMVRIVSNCAPCCGHTPPSSEPSTRSTGRFRHAGHAQFET